ncbi:hypothetical protein QJQ45_026618 [Haematococcus lacustris]|nr:hypothetical protein QJQ45_026618 [Haematococcus lacustris]
MSTIALLVCLMQLIAIGHNCGVVYDLVYDLVSKNDDRAAQQRAHLRPYVHCTNLCDEKHTDALLEAQQPPSLSLQGLSAPGMCASQLLALNTTALLNTSLTAQELMPGLGYFTADVAQLLRDFLQDSSITVQVTDFCAGNRTFASFSANRTLVNGTWPTLNVTVNLLSTDPDRTVVTVVMMTSSQQLAECCPASPSPSILQPAPDGPPDLTANPKGVGPQAASLLQIILMGKFHDHLHFYASFDHPEENASNKNARSVHTDGAAEPATQVAELNLLCEFKRCPVAASASPPKPQELMKRTDAQEMVLVRIVAEGASAEGALAHSSGTHQAVTMRLPSWSKLKPVVLPALAVVVVVTIVAAVVTTELRKGTNTGKDESNPLTARQPFDLPRIVPIGDCPASATHDCAETRASTLGVKNAMFLLFCISYSFIFFFLSL